MFRSYLVVDGQRYALLALPERGRLAGLRAELDGGGAQRRAARPDDEASNVEQMALGLVLRRFDRSELPAVIEAEEAGTQVADLQRELQELRAHRLDYEQEARKEHRPPAETLPYLAGLDAEEEEAAAAAEDPTQRLSGLARVLARAGHSVRGQGGSPESGLDGPDAGPESRDDPGGMEQGETRTARRRKPRQRFDPRRVS